MDISKNTAIWGTGSLFKRFIKSQPEILSQLSCLVDSQSKADVLGITVVSPQEAVDRQITRIIICSSFVKPIVTQCLELGIDEKDISVVLPRSLKQVALCDCRVLSDGEFYYLPWEGMQDVLQPSLSGDIVFPDVYKELVKSVAYTFVSSVEGGFAEFGTCSGYSATLIACAVDFYTKNLSEHESMHSMGLRNLSLFDSFQGFPNATHNIDIESPHVASGAWGEGTAKGLSAHQLVELCSQFLPAERINTYEGWYKDTLGTIPKNELFGLVHIDCDLYESTYDVLYHLLDNNHLSQGCMLLFDNWFSNRASPNFGEQKAWHDIQQKFEVDFNMLGMYACVGNKIIIHGYKKREK